MNGLPGVARDQYCGAAGDGPCDRQELGTSTQLRPPDRSVGLPSEDEQVGALPMSSMTFIINDQTTKSLSTNPRVQVTITENGDGTLKFDIIQLGGVNAYLGDLRGFFFDFARGVAHQYSHRVQCERWHAYRASAERGRRRRSRQRCHYGGLREALGRARTVTEAKGYDVGLEIGTQGIGSTGDDVREFHFTLSRARLGLFPSMILPT